MRDKPTCKLIGQDGNVFNIIALVRRTLIDAGDREKAHEFAEKAMDQHSYDDVLWLCDEYVDVWGSNEEDA